MKNEGEAVTIIKTLVSRYNGDQTKLQLLIQDINLGEFSQRADYRSLLSQMRIKGMKGHCGGPIRTKNKPQTKVHTISKNPGFDEPEILVAHKIGSSELERQTKYDDFDWQIITGWNKMTPKQRIQAIGGSELDGATKNEMMVSILHSEGAL